MCYTRAQCRDAKNIWQAPSDFLGLDNRVILTLPAKRHPIADTCVMLAMRWI